MNNPVNVMDVKMVQAYKYAVDMNHLSDNLKIFFMKSFGCVRKVYNLYVNDLYATLEDAGYEKGDDIPSFKCREISEFKKEFPYLKEVDSLALSNAKLNFEGAFKRFRDQGDHTTYTKRAVRRSKSGTEPLSFRGLKGMLSFHSAAHGYYSYTTTNQFPKEGKTLKRPTIRLEGNRLFLPKLKEGIVLRLHRKLPEDAKITNVTVSMDTDGTFHVSICFEYTCKMDMTLRQFAESGAQGCPENARVLGLDYSNPCFYIDSEGRKANYPQYYKKVEEKLARLQKKLSHMKKGSSNYNKMKAKIDRLHVKIKNQRYDFCQKQSTKLVNEYDIIVVEDINLNAMGQALKLGKNLHDNGFGMFRNMLAYKLERKGSVLVKVDKWFPSTKTCGNCGSVNRNVTLGVSEWDCPVCGHHNLRDENAAANIREEGKRIFADFYREWLEEKEKAETKSRNRKLALAASRKKKPDTTETESGKSA